MEIILTPELETEIKKRANERGVSPQELLLSEIHKLFAPPETQAEKPAETLYDFLQEFVGVNKNDNPTDDELNLSQNTGEKFTDLLMQKHQNSQK